MLFKLSLKNMKKSFKDYAIYFLTLVLGVAIFYMFNSLDSQQAMLQISSSQKEMIGLLLDLLSYVSVFVAIILALLIIYASNFLINRRKKEFGIYMTLGMGRRQISKLILMETILVGILSLGVGLGIGIFASQFMSIIVSKLFNADMSEFTFIFSKVAAIKTCIYFAIMYIIVLLLNTYTISKYKLINLLTAIKKNEKVKIKNSIISILVFIIACFMLGWAYYRVTVEFSQLRTAIKLLVPIVMGVMGTILVFWSLSGFILKFIGANKRVYLSGTNMFVLRQINNKINTTVISMSVICLMLFMTITALSSSLSLKSSLEKQINEMTPVDINLFKTTNLSEDATEELKQFTKETVIETLDKNGLDIKLLKDVIEIPVYEVEGLTWKKSLGYYYEQAKTIIPIVNKKETIVKISDYNKIARLYGNEEYQLNNNEYIVVCNSKNMIEMRNKALSYGNNTININGKNYNSKYDECKTGFILISVSYDNMGIIVVPDNCNLTEDMKQMQLMVANYNADTDEEKKKIDEIFTVGSWGEKSEIINNLLSNGIVFDGMTKINNIESSNGLAAIIIFIAIYLGIVFLIASSAILALKQLTESSDNKQRYDILRKIGCDEKMINSALFKQIGIFFLFPLVLAIIHSIFGIQFGFELLAGLATKEELLPSSIATVIIIGIIYGAYFIATYIGSKNIIKEND